MQDQQKCFARLTALKHCHHGLNNKIMYNLVIYTIKGWRIMPQTHYTSEAHEWSENFHCITFYAQNVRQIMQ